MHCMKNSPILRRAVRLRAGPVEFNSNLSIVLYADPKLRARNIRISSFDDKVKKLMLDVTYRRDGVGLSAPQVGVNARLMVFNPEGERGKGKEYVFVNPMIVKFGKEREADTLEGCLPFYACVFVSRDRYRSELKAQDINGKKFGTAFRGWTAGIFRHEYDHLEGVLYIDQMTPKSLNSNGQELLCCVNGVLWKRIRSHSMEYRMGSLKNLLVNMYGKCGALARKFLTGARIPMFSPGRSCSQQSGQNVSASWSSRRGNRQRNGLASLERSGCILG
ncbi:peptide deformylase 1B, chloroplastic/mitochondrial [Selaginella moellendorffii]|uniref:peptide deformylase 1B, chloroplastic/mitochondrial n=1 Tax=Selaginella moellendorffii TaxID=88036 RepID=UPI000D1CB7B7|nr:peptide deformylase 1B, chloroplastic/mitochondrial [Selaginella moellendorffii]|eukprot:XP_024527317.1 peptide deformylase 1B, chloroplastic/mitochondrial [Selaginella moellendorffii]